MNAAWLTIKELAEVIESGFVEEWPIGNKVKTRIPRRAAMLLAEEIAKASKEKAQRLQSSPAPDGQPIVAEAFADNGAHSHWYLIDAKTGDKLWSEDPEECAARGFSVSSPAPVVVPEKPYPVLDLHGEEMRGLSLEMWHRGWDALASRLSSPNAVAGGVPEWQDCGLTPDTMWEEIQKIRRILDDDGTKGSPSEVLASRLRTVQPGECVVSAEEWAEVRLFLAYMGLTEYPYDGSDGLLPSIPFDGDYDDWSFSLCKKLGITSEILTEHIRNSALRAQATTNEKES